MTLNTAIKNWLAQNAGASNCFASSGIVYRDPDNISRTGGTGDVLNAFFVAHLIGKDTAVIIASTNYTSLKSINGGLDIALDDVTWAYNNDGSPSGEARYCIGATPTPTSTPTPTPTPGPIVPGLAGTFIFSGAPSGSPSVNLDLTGLTMRQNTADYHFEMNQVKITNTSSYPVYLAMEVKLFTGVRTTCPSSGEVFDGMDRYIRAADNAKVARTKTLEPGATATYSTDFYQPSSIVGVHTVCLLIHGTWILADLTAEIAPITG